MQISDLMGQYNQGTASGTEKLTGTKGVENLVASLRSLTKGNIFEGTVSSMKNGRVTLSLSSGQQIMARMDGKVSLNVGQSMFFQVKSNDGTQIAIRPFVTDGNGGNYALMQALSAAGLPAESNYLSMVNRMMEEQMPIDRASLQQMARTVNLNSEMDVQTVVQLKKLGIPITPENASQFENYLDDKQAITKEIDTFIQELPTALQGEELPTEQLRQTTSQVLSIITEGLPDVPEEPLPVEPGQPAAADVVGQSDSESVPGQPEAAEVPGQSDATGLAGQPEAAGAPGQTNTASVPGQTDAAGTPEQPISDSAVADQESSAATDATVQMMQTESEMKEAVPTPAATPHTLAAMLEPEQLQSLNQMIGELLGTEDASYTPQSGAVEVLKDLQQVFSDALPVEREHISRLLASEEFQTLVKDTLEQQWMVEPQALKENNQVERLYQRLNSQMERIEDALKASGQENTNVSQMAADIRSNMEFMNQINQVYTYVQIPLKMSGQNASGELYVYTNKKALAEGNQELTAFLHLDMEHLGPTDVSVRLRGHEVSTNFYLDNDEAYALIEKHYPILEQRLKEKGYDCKVSVINEENHVNFVEDFLKKDQPSAGQLHRYSFDMRA